MMDVEQILLKMEELGLIRLSKITGDYYTVYCPIHKHGQERKPSCGVLLREQYRNGRRYQAGFVHCFTCGYAKPLPDMVTDVLKDHGINKNGIDWLVENVPGFEPPSDDELETLVSGEGWAGYNEKAALEFISSLKNKKEYVPESELEQYRFTVPYMYERGLTDEIIEKYDIGFDANHIPYGKKKQTPCVTFPVRDMQGRCEFIFRRSVEGRYFNYPTGSEKPVYGLYELDPKAKRVVICESAFNALTCIRHGYNAVALFGTGNERQMKQLQSLDVNTYIIALDPDPAGQRGTQKLRKKLSNLFFIQEMKGIPEGKDLNDLTDEEFEDLYIE